MLDIIKTLLSVSSSLSFMNYFTQFTSTALTATFLLFHINFSFNPTANMEKLKRGADKAESNGSEMTLAIKKTVREYK